MGLGVGGGGGDVQATHLGTRKVGRVIPVHLLRSLERAEQVELGNLVIIVIGVLLQRGESGHAVVIGRHEELGSRRGTGEQRECDTNHLGQLCNVLLIIGLLGQLQELQHDCGHEGGNGQVLEAVILTGGIAEDHDRA